MAIQLRRGAYIDFDPTKLTPGEAAVIVSGDPGNVSGVALYLCFSSGVVKRFALTEELESALNDFTVDWSDVTNKPVPDTTLAVQGAFAESKAVGDALTWNRINNRPAINPGTGTSSTAENNATTASGQYAHAEGNGTIAQRKSQHVFGENNIADTQGSVPGVKGKYVEIVGNGSSNSARSNARTLDWSGNETVAGKITVGSAPTQDMDVSTKKYVDDAVDGLRQLTFTDPNHDGHIVITAS